MSLVKAVTTIGGFTLLSRLFGFAREMLMASYLGAGALSDAFFVAFKLPNFLRRLFAEGAFNAGFVPLFAGILEEKGAEEARRFAEEIFAVLTILLAAVVALAEIFMPWVVLAFAPGFDEDPEKFALAVLLSRICFPYILFISLLTLYGGILNSLHRFAAAAAAPILLNLCMIAALVAFSAHLPTAAHAAATGVLMAGLVQFAWMAAACYRAGVLPRWRRPRFSPAVKRLLKLSVPAAFGASVAQINLLIDTVLASLFPGAVSWLYYGDRMNELVIGVIGVAIGTALLPMLTRAIKGGKEALASTRLNQAVLFCLALAVPASAALSLLAWPMIGTLFQHGNFTQADTEAVAPVLVAYGLGLPSFVLVKVLSTGFYAREDTRTPVKIALVCVALNLAGNLILMQFMQHVGLALSTTISGWANVAMMIFVLRRRGHFIPDRPLKSAVLKVIAASALMGLCLFALQKLLPWDGKAMQVFSLAALVGTGLAVYGGAVLALRVVQMDELRQVLRRPARGGEAELTRTEAE